MFGLAAVCCVQFELRPAVCHLRALLLRGGLYRGLLPAAESDDGADDESGMDALHSFDSLRRVVQASDAQLRAQLHSIAAYEVDGYYRLLHDEYARTLVQDVVNACIETRQSADKVHAATVVRTVQHLHTPDIVRQCLRNMARYSHLQHQPAMDDDEDEHTALCPQRLSQQLAHAIFSSATPASHTQQADTLLRTITAALPAPLICQPSYLLTVAALLPSPPPAPSTYRYLPSHTLPADVPGRVQRMFAVKERWTAEEMAAWMDEVAANDSADSSSRAGKPDTALLKHCRTVTEKDAQGNKTVYYFSNRHA